MLMGLKEPPKGEGDTIERSIALKMSKSIPDSAIFMTDSEEDVKRKLNKAYCPEKVVYENPVMDYVRYLIFEKFPEMVIERPEKWGGNLTFANFADLAAAFEKGDLHPQDLKQSVAKYTNELIQPVRDHFEKNSAAKKLFEEVQSFQITR